MAEESFKPYEFKQLATDINRSLFIHDIWNLREQYLSIPEELQDPISVVPILVLLKIMGGQLEEAKRLSEKILTSPAPNAPFVYHSTCIILPQLTLEELEEHINAIREMGRTVFGLTFTAGRPTILNGFRDFSYFGKVLSEGKDRIINMLNILYPTSAEAMYNVGKAEYLYQTNNCLKSMALIAEYIPILEKSGDFQVLFAAASLQMQLLVANGEIKSAAKVVKQIHNQLKNISNEELNYNLDALETKVAIYEGDYKVVENWMNNKSPDEYGNFNIHDMYRYMVKLRGYILTGKFISGLALTTHLRPLLEKSHRPMDLCEMEILIAIGGYKAGLKEEYISALERALELGTTYNYIRIFADEGEPMLKLLNGYKKANPKSKYREYVNKLIEITRQTALFYPNYLLEPFDKKIELTIHELDILKLLSHGLTYEEIAGQSNISINTVRFHIKKIYEKLKVNSSSEALSRAISMGLLY